MTIASLIPTNPTLGEVRLTKPRGYMLQPYSILENQKGELLMTGGSFKDIVRSIGSFFRRVGSKVLPIAKTLAPVAKELATKYGPTVVEAGQKELSKKTQDPNSSLYIENDNKRRLANRGLDRGNALLQSFLKTQRKNVKNEQRANRVDDEVRKLSGGGVTMPPRLSNFQKKNKGSGLLMPYQGKGTNTQKTKETKETNAETELRKLLNYSNFKKAKKSKPSKKVGGKSQERSSVQPSLTGGNLKSF